MIVHTRLLDIINYTFCVYYMNYYNYLIFHGRRYVDKKLIASYDESQKKPSGTWWIYCLDHSDVTYNKTADSDFESIYVGDITNDNYC